MLKTDQVIIKGDMTYKLDPDGQIIRQPIAHVLPEDISRTLPDDTETGGPDEPTA